MANDIIKLLPDSVANQIAAGEVIQRPASVVKELVENAVDAGARSIQIIVKDAGRTLIQVIDDGKGMTPTDARMAFERHATSKISSADDLFTLLTMGFRGEALPSIASVAQIEMRTKPSGETLGSKLSISESAFKGQEPCNTPQGTNIMVKNLFFHLPARRKYLKKDSVELSHILREFERLALVNPSVEFKIIHNDITLHHLSGGNLRQRIDSLFGRTLGGQLIPIGTETSIVKISGFIGAPAHAKKRNAPQFFFVNGRNMRHPYFHKAVMNCYAELISQDSQPVYFINFEVDPSTIDVNIHPQKHEIKFENEHDVWHILTAAIKQALGKANAAGAIDFDAPREIDLPVFNPDSGTAMPEIDTVVGYNPFVDKETDAPSINRRMEQKSRINDFSPSSASRPPKDWNKLYEGFVARRDLQEDVEEKSIENPPVDEHLSTADGPKPLIEINDSHSFLTLDNRYIVVPSRTGLMLIHRRRAHIRVLYEQFLERLTKSSFQSQRLIFPETLSLTPSQNAVMSSMADLLERLGFEVSFLGDNVWSINASPTLPGNSNPREMLMKLIEDMDLNGETDIEKLVEPASLALARSASFNHTSRLSDDDTDALIASLLACKEPSFTPDGLKIIHPIDLNEIQRLFN